MRGLTTLWVVAVLAIGVMPALADPPPRMPRTFDQETVQGLIDVIEQGQNATILKVGYFLRRSRDGYAVMDGYSLLEAALKKEPAFSRRWFVLQSVKAWAAFYAGTGKRDEGYEAYNQIFSNYGRAAGDSQEVVQRSVYELALLLPGQFGTRSFGEERSQEVLLKALQAHLDYLKLTDPGTFKIPWKNAIIATGGWDKFEQLVHTVIDDANVKRTFVLLRTASSAYSVSKPKEAIELLVTAKPLLPLQDPAQVQFFYTDLIELLVSTGQSKEAVAFQNELVNTTGYGRAKLATMQLQSGDDKAFQATVQELEEVTASDSEIIDTVRSLMNAFSSDTPLGSKAHAAVKSILTKYLETRPALKVEQELTARFLLGQDLYRYGEKESAKKTLQIDHLKAGVSTSSEKSLFSAVQELLERIEAAS